MNQNKNIYTLAARIQDWAAINFPNESFESILTHLQGEVEELKEAVREYVAPWSPLDGDFDPEKALQIGNLRRADLADEAADVAIMAFRLMVHAGIDPVEAMTDKWDRVEMRRYNENGQRIDLVPFDITKYEKDRKVEPNTSSDDDRPMGGDLSDDHRTITGRPSHDWIIGTGSVWVSEGVNGFHFTGSKRAAYSFPFEADARTFISEAVMYNENGVQGLVRDIPFLDVYVREVRL